MLPYGVADFLKQHWVFGGIVASLLWFVAGRQSLGNGRPDFAVFWESVSVLISLALCGWAIARGEWVGLLFGVALLGIELRSLVGIRSAKERDH